MHRYAFLSLILVQLCAAQEAGNEYLKVRAGWPEIDIVSNYSPAKPKLDDDGKITASPIRNGELVRLGRYARDAEIPLPVRSLYSEPRSQITSWMEREFKLKPIVLATENAVIVSALRSGESLRKLGRVEKSWLEGEFGKVKSKVSPVELAHLYAMRYLAAEAKMQDLLVLKSRQAPRGGKGRPSAHFGLTRRFEFYVFPTEELYRSFCKHFFGGFGMEASWWFDVPKQVLIGCMHIERDSIAAARARFEHLVTHNLLLGYRGRRTKSPVWLAAGVGHWFERGHRGAADTFIIHGTPASAQAKAWAFRPNAWWAETRRLVSKKEHKTLAQLALIQDHSDLPPRLHVQAWSLVAFMLAQGKDRFRVFSDHFKSRGEMESELEAQDRAFRKAYGVTMVEFEAAWKEWVKRTKPPRGMR